MTTAEDDVRASSSLPGRAAWWLGAAAVLLLAAAGAASLLIGQPLRPLLVRLVVPARGSTGTTESPGGLYRVHPDPLVGYVLKDGIDRDVLAGRVRSDALGLRARPGPPRGEDPLRIVFAGDSVAFGFGLAADDSISARLEEELNAVLGPGARPIECRCVALPGWNHRNTVACVLDHEDVLDPDILVYMPIANDVYDTDRIVEGGHRRTACDPSAADPWLIANQSVAGRLELASRRLLRDAGRDDSWANLGPQAISADISSESSRRFDENADSIARLQQRMAQRGGHFLLAAYQDESYVHHLLRRFADRGLALDVVPLFTQVPESLKLEADPHPAAPAASAMARWIAADLIARGWIEGAVRAVPPAPDDIAALRAPALTPHDVQLVSARDRRLQWQRLLTAIDLSSGDGCNQVLGGVHPDGLAGPHALFLLPRPARRVRVTIAPLAGRPDLLPLDVRVQIDGVDVGALRLPAGAVPADETATATFEMPPHVPINTPGFKDMDVPFEVRLLAAQYTAVSQPDISVLAAYRVVRLEALAD